MGRDASTQSKISPLEYTQPPRELYFKALWSKWNFSPHGWTFDSCVIEPCGEDVDLGMALTSHQTSASFSYLWFKPRT